MFTLYISHLHISVPQRSHYQSTDGGWYKILFVKNFVLCYVRMHFGSDLWLPVALFHVFVTYLSYVALAHIDILFQGYACSGFTFVTCILFYLYVSLVIKRVWW
jgi:hypothetical protein